MPSHSSFRAGSAPVPSPASLPQLTARCEARPTSQSGFLVAAESKSGGGSARPVETITPLANKLGLTLKTHKKSDIEEVAADAMACGGTALICWQHQDIPAIANIIVGNASTVPQKWPGDRFDVVWVFDLAPSSNSYSFNQVPHLLLAGDSPNPIQD